MSDNPFLTGPPKGRIVTIEMLEAQVAKYNAMPQFRREGRPWFVNRRLDEESHEYKHFLDRKI